jgi:hypothetical protein
MKRSILTALLALFLVDFASAQNFIRLTDASGITPTIEEINSIETASQQAIDILPAADRPLFKVYDVGFYIHNVVMIGGILPIWEQIKTDVENLPSSEYYLRFGRESSDEGLNTKIRVKLKLPTSSAYSCLTEEERSNLERYIEQVANDNLNFRYAQAEVAALDLLKDYFYKIIVCNCSNVGANCSQFSRFSLLDIQLRGLGFRKKEIKLGSASTWSSGTQGIFDFAGKKVIIDGTQYDIADQVSEGKALIEASAQVLPDTTISTSISGKVYILDNESFNNGEWEAAKAEASSNDYVEYWVILTNNSGKSFLYSKFTIGEIIPVATKSSDGQNRVATTISPWGLALKALGNAAVDACMQCVVVRLTDESADTWTKSWDKISYYGALWEGISSLIPWKRDLTQTLVRTALSAFVVVLDKAINDSNYSVQQGVTDFSIGFAASGLTQLIAPKIGQYGSKIFLNGLSRLDKATNNVTFNKIIKVVWNYFAKNIAAATPLSNLLTYYSHMIGNTGLKHVFRGEIKAGAALGVHHIAAIRDGSARIIPGSIKKLGKGFYEASVEVLDANGSWILKQGKSTFFPDDWPESKILQEISDIIGNGTAKIISQNSNSVRYEGLLSNGVKVIFTRWPSYNNNILTSFPEI